jgi:hypothetical protein
VSTICDHILATWENTCSCSAFCPQQKGPCHIWEAETAQEKKEAARHLEELNKELEIEMREEWELTTAMRRTGLRNLRGSKPKWKWDAQHGKLTRREGSGIDWYRYQQLILISKLFPFVEECRQNGRPETIVQEDGAASHASKHQIRAYNRAGIDKLLWPGNSPDLNMIEPCWPFMKRHTTKKGAPTRRPEAKRAWFQAWDELEQWRIQSWIERIPRHIQEVIRLEGDNNYREGAEDQTRTGKRARDHIVR